MNLDLIWLAVSLFTWGVGEGMFFYFQPLYLQQLGAQPLAIGVILGAAGLAMTVTHIPAGHLADRIGRRPMLWAAWLIGLLSAWLMALAPSLPFFVAGLLLYNVTAFVSSPLSSYVTAARGRWPVGRALTLISATFNLGMVLGPFTGGWIADTFTLRTVYFAAACFFVISTALVLFLRSQPRDGHDPDAPPVNLLSNGRYLGFLIIAFIAMFAMYLPQPLASNFLQNERGLSFSQIGLLGTFGGLGNALLSLGLGALNARLGFLLGQICVALFAFLIWRGAGVPLYALGYFLLGGYRVARSLAVAQARALVHQSQMGLAYGIMETVNSLPIILAPPLAGYLYHLNPETVYPVSLAALAVAFLVSLLFTPRPMSTDN